MTLLDDAVDALRHCAAQRLEPAEARKHLATLRDEHPDARLRLVWQREEYDGSLHYDLLVRRGDEPGVVSLAWCPDDALPWPLRGVQRAGEMVLARVNGFDLEVGEAIGYLDLLWEQAPLRDRLVDACLVREALDEIGVELTEEEVQAAADAFRRARGLLTAADTRAWMARHHLTEAQFEALVVHQAKVARLRERVTAGAVAKAPAADLDLIRYVRVDAADADAAARLAASPDLLIGATVAFVAGTGPAPVLAATRRGDLPEPLRRALADAREGEVVGPVPVDGVLAVVRVLAVEPAAGDAATRDALSRRIFADWLARRRAAASVEWNWGPRDRS